MSVLRLVSSDPWLIYVQSYVGTSGSSPSGCNLSRPLRAWQGAALTSLAVGNAPTEGLYPRVRWRGGGGCQPVASRRWCCFSISMLGAVEMNREYVAIAIAKIFAIKVNQD